MLIIYICQSFEDICNSNLKMSVIPLKISAILLRIFTIDLKRYNLFHDISDKLLQDIFNHLKMGVIPLKIAAINFF